MIAPVPVNAASICHIEANEQDPICAELSGKIDSLKARIAAAANDANRIELHFSSVSGRAFFAGNLNPNYVREIDAVSAPAELQPIELRQAAPVFPPRPVAPVNRVSPRAEIDAFLDG